MDCLGVERTPIKLPVVASLHDDLGDPQCLVPFSPT